jgi:hypothetical protein
MHLIAAAAASAAAVSAAVSAAAVSAVSAAAVSFAHPAQLVAGVRTSTNPFGTLLSMPHLKAYGFIHDP